MARVPLVLLALSAALAGQGVSDPALDARLGQADPEDWIPVYGVVAARLDLSSLEGTGPRGDRRARILDVLRGHGAAHQGVVAGRLGALQGQGRARRVAFNWVGNFVSCEVRAEAFPELAQDPSIESWWLEVVYNPAEITDGVEGAVRSVPWDPSLSPGAGPAPLNTRADLCWCLGVDGTGVIIMNADLGIDGTHLDLANRRWSNPGEIPSNGLDDDGNGFVDDVNGWNFFLNNGALSDLGGHGTRTAGAMVADGSCNGVIHGQAPGARVMTAVITSEVQQWNAVQYALTMGADLQTSAISFGTDLPFLPNMRMHREVSEAAMLAGMLRINSASNNGGACSVPSSLARRPFNISLPAACPAPWRDPNQTLVGGLGGVLAVGAHDLSSNVLMPYSPCGPFAWAWTDLLAVIPAYPMANWNSPSHDDYPWAQNGSLGLLKPDLTGPTGALVPAAGPCGFVTFSGTSNAAPVVAGCVALWKSANPSLDAEDLAMIAQQTAAPSGSVLGKENGHGAGRVDARAGLDLAWCVHRVEGSCAFERDVQGGAPVTLEVDAPPGVTVIVGVGGTRLTHASHGGVIALGGQPWILWQGVAPPSGDVQITLWVPTGLIGQTFYTQAFADGQTTAGGLLSSNVVASRIVP